MQDIPPIQFSKNDQKIRAHWILASRIIYLAWPCLAALGLIINYSENFLIESISIGIANVVGYLIVINCAYKKHGTAWLSFILFMSALGRVKELNEVLQEPTFINSLLYVMDLCLYLWWFGLTLQLRKINDDIQDSLRRTNPCDV